MVVMGRLWRVAKETLETTLGTFLFFAHEMFRRCCVTVGDEWELCKQVAKGTFFL